MKRPLILLLLLMLVFLFACPMVEAGDVPKIFEYIPIECVEQHPAAMLGFQIYYLNISQLRKDLALPDLTKPDAEKVKRDFLQGSYTHGLSSYSVDHVDEWGMDIAGISQELFCSEINTWIIIGDFDNPKIQSYFLKSEYTKRNTIDSFTIYHNQTSELSYALSAEALIVSPDSYFESVVRFIKQKKEPWGSASQDPVIKEFFNHSLNVTGVFMAPSGDFIKFLKRYNEEGKVPVCIFNWDMMFLSFGQERNPDTLYCYYHYSSQEMANINKDFVKRWFIKTPSLHYQNKTWADLIDVKLSEVDKKFVVLKGVAKIKKILNEPFIYQDYYGFLPITCENQ